MFFRGVETTNQVGSLFPKEIFGVPHEFSLYGRCWKNGSDGSINLSLPSLSKACPDRRRQRELQAVNLNLRLKSTPCLWTYINILLEGVPKKCVMCLENQWTSCTSSVLIGFDLVVSMFSYFFSMETRCFSRLFGMMIPKGWYCSFVTAIIWSIWWTKWVGFWGFLKIQRVFQNVPILSMGQRNPKKIPLKIRRFFHPAMKI